MNPYLAIPLGWILGLLVVVVVASIRIQMNDKYEENFVQAFKKYLKKGTGRLVLSILMMLIAMFILPDVIANVSGENENATKYKKLINNVLGWIRTYAVIGGLIAETAGFWLVNRKNKIFKEVDEPKTD